MNGRGAEDDVSGARRHLSKMHNRPTCFHTGKNELLKKIFTHPLEQPAFWYSVILLLDRFLPQTKDIGLLVPHFQTVCCNYPHMDLASTELQKLCNIVCRCSLVLLYKNVLQNVEIIFLLIILRGIIFYATGRFVKIVLHVN